MPDVLTDGEDQQPSQEASVNCAPSAATDRNLAESPTRQPTKRPTTRRPTTRRPTTRRPTAKPTTRRPTSRPSTRRPTTRRPTTRRPTTTAPSRQPTSQPTLPEISKQAAKDAKEYAMEFSANMTATYPADLRTPGCNCLNNTGATTDTQLQNFFRKCVTPGSTITLGILGGSISQMLAGYQVTWLSYLQQMCPTSTVKLYNGARPSTGSMTLGYCAKTSVGGPEEVDLFVTEFTLNDGAKYTTDGEFSSQSYEFLLRNTLTAFQYAPAIITLHLWGFPFVYDSPQPALVALAQRYALSAISIRDAVWPYYTAQREPLATKSEVTMDGIHPSPYVQRLTADLLHTYVVGKFLEWVDSAIDGTASQTAGTEPVALPEASNSRLNKYKVEEAKIDCAIVPSKDRDNGRAPVLIDPSGFSIDPADQLACVKFTSDTPRTKVQVATQTGRIFISNCYFADRTFRVYGAERASAISVHNVVAGEWLPLMLSQLVDGIAEGFEVEPPLAPGTYTLGITKNPTCVGQACSEGFLAIAGL
eukprot:TRINITY_DN4624_c0_g1_i5.p1 TRINITY_DN4624_c0_g1~~TRINITY_DN4624_c0_g1_i5.p1  ORF type:complete len:579 (+),score=100.20 TRINITY_DN4624_c0_g1_i5:142-1737(+)